MLMARPIPISQKENPITSWYSGDIIANGIRIHYYRTGGDRPSLVLAHGLTDSGPCWTRLVQVLEQDFDIVMVDARGHGLSEAPEEGYNGDSQAADLAGVIEALGLRKPVLMGHSMGALTTAIAAGNYPDLVRAVILEDPPWLLRPEDPKSPSEQADLLAHRRALIAETRAKTREEVIASGRAENPTWAEAEWIPWAEAKLHVSVNAVGVLAARWPSWQEIIDKITCPILLLYASGFVNQELAEQISGRWNSGRAVYISDAGHNIRRDQFDKTSEAVKEFLSVYVQ